MRTLYLRNVPDDVVERLERLAARDGMSISAVAIRELAEVSVRAIERWARPPPEATEQLHVPHLIDTEIASGLPRQVAFRGMSSGAGWQALDTWRRLGVTRHPTFTVLERVWELRQNFSSYDASYVALAEALQVTLATADTRLVRGPGLRCTVTVLEI